MEQYVIDLSKWDKIGNKYIYPDTPEGSNWYLHGFTPKNDYTINLFGWYGFAFETDVDGAEEIKISAQVLEFREGRNVEVSDTFTWSAVIAGKGRKKIIAPLSQFDLYTCEPNKWTFVRSVEINREVYNLKAIRANTIYMGSDIMSKPAKTGETVKYEIEIANCTDEAQAVRLDFKKKGWETLECKIDPEIIVLAPMQAETCELEVKMNERVVPGGFEKQIVRAIPNGDGENAVELEFYTVKYLPHPYLAHTEDGWQEVIEKTKKYDWAKTRKSQYQKTADEWEIPKTDSSKPYLYITDNAHKCYNSAIVWKLTGDIKYAEKSAKFLRSVADPETGYPKTLQACNQQMVHEGEFFKSCAFAYDLIRDTGLLTDEDRENIHNAFRIFAWRIDWELKGGGMSNWSLAMIAGAMYCAMCIQDRSLIERFIRGIGGIVDHMTAGVLPDGWWCECTIGYNQMAAGLFSEYAQALLPWGINLKEMWFPAQYAPTVQPRVQHIDGLSWDIYGGSTKNYRCIKDLWDSLVAMGDYRGVVIGVNDSAESKFGGTNRVAFDARYDIAYAHYGDPAYANIIRLGGDELRDLLHGIGEIPDVESDVHRKSCYFDNAGVSMLRSQTEGRDDREQYQGSLKYGSHGGAHGHYDRCAMNSLSRYGRNFYNPENIWYAYGTFMYKFFVQNSITHNMVTVDLKLQEPAEGRNLLFHTGKMMQVNAVENITKWSNPPYGGWRVLMDEEFADRSWNEGRYVPIPENAPEYTTRTDFTEPVTQRRLMIVTDEYAVNFDYISGENEHEYDCIYHARDFKKIKGVKEVKRTEQLATDPLSSAQFITDCTWYKTDSDTVKTSFAMDFTENEAAKPGWRVPYRSGYNEIGHLGIDIYYASAKDSEVIIGGDPEYVPVNKRLTYRVEADGETVADGKFGAWILGRDEINADISGKKELKLYVKCEKAFVEVDWERDFEKTIFWGDPCIVTRSGRRIYLSGMAYECENVDTGNGVGKDYFGGDVTIQAKKFDKAVPSEPIDIQKEAVITIDLSDIDAVRFESAIGGDYPLGDGKTRRRLLAQRKKAKTASFISVIELYETKNKVKTVTALSDNSVRVELKDGTSQEITITNLDTGKGITAEIKEYKNGELIRAEKTEG